MNFKKTLRTPEGAAFMGALTVGFLAHLFGLVNVIHNYDSVLRLPYDYGSGIPHGRWGLQLLGDLAQRMGGNTNLPLVNGLLFLVLVALSAGFLISVLRIHDTKQAALIGMLLSVFPTAASILIHRYAAVYYGISMLLAVLAVWVIHRSKLGPVWSVLCITLSLGIYQAFIPITISAFVLLMIRQALEGESDFFSIVKRGILYCAVLIAGLVLYYLIQELAMKHTGISMVEYQGVSQMGQLDLLHLPKLMRDAAYLVCMLPMRDYFGLSDTLFLRLAYALLGCLTAGLVLYILIVKIRKLSIALLTLVLCGLFLVAVNFIYVMCPDGMVYTLMIYGVAMVVCTPVVALECLPREEGKRARIRVLASKGISVGLLVLILSYSYLANTNYTAMYYADQQVKTYMSSMVVQIRMTEGYDTEKEWAFIGEISDPNLFFTWQPLMNYGGFTGPSDLLACHSTFSWVKYYTGYHPPMASAARISELAAMEEVKAMPCWPNAGSIKAVGNAMVIKCQELN